VIEGVFVAGSITGTWRLRCARCLTEETRPFTVEIGELVTPVATDPDKADDDYVLVDEQIDIDQIVRDAIGVEMPFAPLCRPDCRGLCPTCGGNRNLGECPGHDAIDPRFAVLSELLIDLPTTDDPN